jgi:glycosidase
MIYGMPGIPCVYYGSEWGALGDKAQGDPALRISFEKPQWNELTEVIAKLSEIKKHSHALNYGGFRSVLLNNGQCIFERKSEKQRVLVAINMDSQPFMAYFDAGCATATDLLTGKTHEFARGSELPAYGMAFWEMEN